MLELRIQITRKTRSIPTPLARSELRQLILGHRELRITGLGSRLTDFFCFNVDDVVDRE